MGGIAAVLVIDMQVGVLGDCHDAQGVTARCAALVDRARSGGAVVIWIQDHDDFPPESSPWELVDVLLPAAKEVRVRKTRRDSFVGTDLEGILRRLGVEQLVVCGAQTDFCVQTTTFSAAVRGFDVVLVSDAHTTVAAEHDGVAITAQQIIAHANAQFAGLRYPGQRFGVAPHDRITFSSQTLQIATPE
ncbi:MULTISPECIES: cysteine hydrolase family protein [Rathayibacter]|nr:MULTISPECIES: cysteine hydrolase family protein [Rathayibacter]